MAVDAAGQHQLAARVDDALRAQPFAERRDTLAFDADVGTKRLLGSSDRAASDHEIERHAPIVISGRAARAAGRIGRKAGYSERRKLSMSCFALSGSTTNRLITPFASDPELACWRIATFRSEVRPSCRKKIRCPTPHSGAVRNSLGPASPCLTPSASPTPMSWTKRSEKRFTCL